MASASGASGVVGGDAPGGNGGDSAVGAGADEKPMSKKARKRLRKKMEREKRLRENGGTKSNKRQRTLHRDRIVTQAKRKLHADYIRDAEYVISNGLRFVRPYAYTFRA